MNSCSSLWYADRSESRNLEKDYVEEGSSIDNNNRSPAFWVALRYIAGTREPHQIDLISRIKANLIDKNYIWKTYLSDNIDYEAQRYRLWSHNNYVNQYIIHICILYIKRIHGAWKWNKWTRILICDTNKIRACWNYSWNTNLEFRANESRCDLDRNCRSHLRMHTVINDLYHIFDSVIIRKLD